MAAMMRRAVLRICSVRMVRHAAKLKSWKSIGHKMLGSKFGSIPSTCSNAYVGMRMGNTEVNVLTPVLLGEEFKRSFGERF